MPPGSLPEDGGDDPSVEVVADDTQVRDHECPLQPTVRPVESGGEGAAAVHDDVVVDDEEIAGFEDHSVVVLRQREPEVGQGIVD